MERKIKSNKKERDIDCPVTTSIIFARIKACESDVKWEEKGPANCALQTTEEDKENIAEDDFGVGPLLKRSARMLKEPPLYSSRAAFFTTLRNENSR